MLPAPDWFGVGSSNLWWEMDIPMAWEMNMWSGREGLDLVSPISVVSHFPISTLLYHIIAMDLFELILNL